MAPEHTTSALKRASGDDPEKSRNDRAIKKQKNPPDFS
jgi:hypothetical protein